MGWAVVNSVLNLRVPWNAGKLSSGLTSSGLSSSARLHIVSIIIAMVSSVPKGTHQNLLPWMLIPCSCWVSSYSVESLLEISQFDGFCSKQLINMCVHSNMYSLPYLSPTEWFPLQDQDRLGFLWKKNLWPKSASELYLPRDLRLSMKIMPTFADRWCNVVSVTDPYGRNLGFLDRSRYFFFQVAPQLY
jgi:hypothetical protein